MNKKNNLPQFQTDYVISWDFSNGDGPCIVISKLDKEGAGIRVDVVGQSFNPIGCVSIKQALEQFEANKRKETNA